MSRAKESLLDAIGLLRVSAAAARLACEDAVLMPQQAEAFDALERTIGRALVLLEGVGDELDHARNAEGSEAVQ